MDLRLFFRRIREIESGFTEAFVVVVSEKTEDGGLAGVTAEVRADLAARLIVEGKARAASAEEASQFRKERAEQFAISQRPNVLPMQVMVVAEDELRHFKGERKRKETEK